MATSMVVNLVKINLTKTVSKTPPTIPQKLISKASCVMIQAIFELLISERFHNPDLPRAFGYGRIHRQQNDERGDDRRDTDDDIQKNAERGNARHIKFFDLRSQKNLIVGKTVLQIDGDLFGREIRFDL